MKKNRWRANVIEEKYLFRLIVGMSLMAILIVVVFEFIFIRLEISGVTAREGEKEKVYEKHYALIVDELNDPFWQSVYEAAREEGKQENIYVEYLGKELAEDYTVNERLKIAIASKVDGVLVVPEDEGTEVLLEEAMKQGIGVVTMLNDSVKGNRNSFIGVNSSSLGSVYGQEITRFIADNAGSEGIQKKTKRIMILMDDNMASTNQNMICLGIKEALKAEDVVIEMKVIDSKYKFSAEETIRNIILRGNEKPDIIVCLSAVDTLCAYQALVDYNKVGEINIIGYYEAQGILEGISKQVIYSTVSIDSLEMGRKGVQALEEYENTGRVNAYFTVETRIINKDNVGSYLMKKDE